MGISDKALVIGLCGRAQHGKSTLAAQLVEFFGGAAYVQRTAFADPIKVMLAAFGLRPEHLYGSQKMDELPMLGGHTPRWAMQSLGTEWGRKLMYRDIWLDAWERTVMGRPQPIVIVEDVRFASEIHFLQEHGALLLEVHRPSMMPSTLFGWARHWIKSRFAHASERIDYRKYGITRIINDTDPYTLLLRVLMHHPFLQDYHPKGSLGGLRIVGGSDRP